MFTSVLDVFSFGVSGHVLGRFWCPKNTPLGPFGPGMAAVGTGGTRTGETGLETGTVGTGTG